MLARINRNIAPAYWDDFFNDNFYKKFNSSACQTHTPAVNVLEDEKAFIIEVAAPGVKKTDFNLELEKDVLIISTEKKEDKKDQQPNYLRREFNFQSFKRSFELPDSIDREGIKASHEAGILRVNLPKREEVVQKVTKQIEVK